MTEKNGLMFEEDRKIYGDCKFYVAEICGMESLTYGARIYQHIDTQVKNNVHAHRTEEVEEERID